MHILWWCKPDDSGQFSAPETTSAAISGQQGTEQWALQQGSFQMNVLILYVAISRLLCSFIYSWSFECKWSFLPSLCWSPGSKPAVNGNRLLPSQRKPITASLSSTTNIENIIWALACLNYFQVESALRPETPSPCTISAIQLAGMHAGLWNSGCAQCTNTQCWQKVPPFNIRWCLR